MFTDTHCHVFHPKIADKALAQCDWEPSVKPLTAFPVVLDRIASEAAE